MLFEIRAYGQWEYHCLTITEMNVAYWRGDHDRHVYAMQTGIAPPGSAPAPTNLALAPLSTTKARLTWDYPADVRTVQKFVVMKRAGHIGTEYNPPFQEIVAEVWANERAAEVDIEAKPRVLFTVVAVDEMGNRSGYSNLAVYPADELLPEVDRVFGVTQTPDGAIYVLNSDAATLFGLSPTGARLSFGSTVQFDAPEVVACVASDGDGILYVPNPKGGYVYRVDPSKEVLLDSLTCDAFQKPRGIAYGPDGNLYVTDLGAKQVHVVTTKGKLLGSFGDPEKLVAPRNVYVDKKGLVYVVDCAMEGAEFRKAPATIYVFRKTSPAGWDFEPVLTVEGLSWIECVIADDQGRIYAGGSGGIHAFDAAGQRLAQWQSKPYGTPAGAEVVCGMAWTRDGTLLVTQGFTLRQLIRVTLDEIFSKDKEQ
jgi:glucose/arabinose dehydrogenase